ncbi:hypothetical protein [Sphaerotilus mobilis]|uniref:Uncharacterized protein n=1 Tax=Sphaerotilus mobilis TaxID=47994 RepID=A0A4Q7LDF6_9BURK|nr:hypothetical protein [Sphaerotilus mobilis]RZS52084.1 hypothetical protein EV685_3273 [Sphaerotilus mobilis]
MASFALSGAAQAAPLDALVSADNGPAGLRAAGSTGLTFTLARDAANGGLDVLGWRQQAGKAGTSVGNYGGWQAGALWQAGRLKLDGSAWQRHIDDGALTQSLRSWKLGGQWRLNGPDRLDAGLTRPATLWALRASAWGSDARRLTRQTRAALVAGTLDSRLSTLSLERPRDRQTQFDLLMSRALTPAWSLHAALGAGRSRVGNQAVQGTADVAGCPYTLDFGAERLVATPADSCGNALIVAVPNTLLPSAAQPETNYRARLGHLALALRLDQPGWSATMGYERTAWRRERIDALIDARGGTALRASQSLIAELQLDLAPGLAALLRAQAMDHAFLAELPLAYNTQTTGQFSHRYGLVSAGLVARF